MDRKHGHTHRNAESDSESSDDCEGVRPRTRGRRDGRSHRDTSEDSRSPPGSRSGSSRRLPRPDGRHSTNSESHSHESFAKPRRSLSGSALPSVDSKADTSGLFQDDSSVVSFEHPARTSDSDDSLKCRDRRRHRTRSKRGQGDSRSRSASSRSGTLGVLLIAGAAAALVGLAAAVSSRSRRARDRETSRLRAKAASKGIGIADGIRRHWRPPRSDEELWWVESCGEKFGPYRNDHQRSLKWERWDERTEGRKTCRERDCDRLTDGGIIDTLYVSVPAREDLEPVEVQEDYPDGKAMCEYCAVENGLAKWYWRAKPEPIDPASKLLMRLQENEQPSSRGQGSRRESL